MSDLDLSDERAKTKHLIVVSSSVAGILVSACYAYFAAGDQDLRSLMWILCGLVWFLILIASFHVKNMSYMVGSVIAVGYSVIFSEALLYDGINTLILPYFGVGTVIVALSLDRKHVTFTCGIGCLLTVIVCYYRVVSVVALFNFLVILVFLTLLANIFLYFEKRYLERLAIEKENVESLLRILNHDINNHIFVIMGSAQILKEKEAMDMACVDRVLRATDKINRISENSRRLLALKNSKKHMHVEIVDLVKACQEAIVDFETHARRQEVQIEMLPPQGDPDNFLAFADPSVVSDNVLANLISNAIKFTPAGGFVRVSLELVEPHILIHIEDSGIGIPKDLVTKLFEKYEMTSRTGLSGDKGTGFGLPNVKFLVEKMGGEISVKSRCREEGYAQNSGTIFTVALPAHFPADAAAFRKTSFKRRLRKQMMLMWKRFKQV